MVTATLCSMAVSIMDTTTTVNMKDMDTVTEDTDTVTEDTNTVMEDTNTVTEDTDTVTEDMDTAMSTQTVTVRTWRNLQRQGIFTDSWILMPRLLCLSCRRAPAHAGGRSQ